MNSDNKIKKKLSDVLSTSRPLDDLDALWDSIDAAPDTTVLPRGRYLADIIRGELFRHPRTDSQGYKLTFVVADGDHVGGRFWGDIWLTRDSMAYGKRDLARLGITKRAQLDSPLPAVFRCKVDLDVLVKDDGRERNEVRRFEVVEVIRKEPDAFAPASLIRKADLPKVIPTAPKTSSETVGQETRGPRRIKKVVRKIPRSQAPKTSAPDDKRGHST